ncbi:MAG: imidazolonepropionase [Terriglobales bacterium]
MPALLLTNIGQLLTLQGPPGPRRGRDLAELAIIEDAAVLCHAGKVVSLGKRRGAERDSWLKSHKKKVEEIDCHGGVVLPGFVDSHTHPAFAAPRLVDFEKRTAGASYEEIATAGGGIRASVEGVRKTTRAGLADKIVSALNEMAAQGTTTVEAKSGYGLNLEAELKSLEAIRSAASRWPGTIVSTLLGAHVVPSEYANRREDYVRLICEQMIPQVARRKLAQFVDVFCDRGAFTEEESTLILKAALANKLDVRAHVAQLGQPSSGFLPSLLHCGQPASLDHCDHVSGDDISALAQQDTVVTLLPGANYFLGLDRYPPARKLIDAGVPLALATDYNPGTSPSSNMQMVLSLGCTHLGMSPAEAVSAATINGAHALRLGDRKGSIEVGKDADLAVFAVPDYREISYWFGSNLCGLTVINGERWQIGPH